MLAHVGLEGGRKGTQHARHKKVSFLRRGTAPVDFVSANYCYRYETIEYVKGFSRRVGRGGEEKKRKKRKRKATGINSKDIMTYGYCIFSNFCRLNLVHFFYFAILSTGIAI